MKVVQATFKPEFLNRLDDVILFDSLNTEELGRIVDLQVARLGKRLADRRLTSTSPPGRGSGWRSPGSTRSMAHGHCAG
jgi:ATP-dependent Clp protease ATP-binding subunit ClpB